MQETAGAGGRPAARLCRASPLPRPSSRHPKVLKATPDGPHRCTKRGGGALRVAPGCSCRDAGDGSCHTRFHCGGQLRWGGGGGLWQHHPGPPPPNTITGCFISVVIWGHFSQEPSTVEMKAGCRRQRFGGRREMQGLRGWLRPRSPAERLSNPPPPSAAPPSVASGGALPWPLLPFAGREHPRGAQGGPMGAAGQTPGQVGV